MPKNGLGFFLNLTFFSMKFYQFLCCLLCLLASLTMQADPVTDEGQKLYNTATQHPSREAYRDVCLHFYNNNLEHELYNKAIEWFRKRAGKQTNTPEAADLLLYESTRYLIGNTADTDAFLRKAKQALNIYRRTGFKHGEAEACAILSEYYNYADVSQAPQYLKRGIELLGNEKSLLNTTLHINYAYAQCVNNNYAEAIKLSNKSIELAMAIKEHAMAANAHTLLGIISRRQNHHMEAFNHYQEALKLLRPLNLPSEEAYVLSNLSSLCIVTHRTEEAINYARESALAADKGTDTDQQALSWCTYGNILLSHKHYQKATGPLLKGFRLGQVTQQVLTASYAAAMLMYNYQMRSRTDSANYYMKIAEGYIDRLPPNSMSYISYMHFKGKVLIDRKQYKQALPYLQYTRQASTTSSSVNSSDLFHELAQCYAGMGHYREAHTYADSAYTSMLKQADNDLKQQMTDFAARYNLQQKELRNAQLATSLARQQAHTRELWLAIVVLLIVIVALITFWLWRRKARTLREQVMRREAETNAMRNYVEGLEDERSRLARELHDGVCNELAAMRMLALSGKPAHEVARLAEESRQCVRHISHRLMPPEFKNCTLPMLLDNLTRQTDESNADTDVAFEADVPEKLQLPTDVAYALYRITQEVLGNILRHAQPSFIEVRLKVHTNDSWQLQVVNDGQPPANTSPQGIGSRTIKSRATGIGAHTSFTTNKAGITCFCIEYNHQSTE